MVEDLPKMKIVRRIQGENLHGGHMHDIEQIVPLHIILHSHLVNQPTEARTGSGSP